MGEDALAGLVADELRQTCPQAFIDQLSVGTADTAFKYIAPELGAFFIYALTMAILLWRPRGLFGHA